MHREYSMGCFYGKKLMLRIFLAVKLYNTSDIISYTCRLWTNIVYRFDSLPLLTNAFVNRRRDDDVVTVVLQARAHETGTAEGGHARRTVRIQTQRRQQRGLHRRPMLRVDIQRILQVRIHRCSYYILLLVLYTPITYQAIVSCDLGFIKVSFASDVLIKPFSN